jgi:brefeldin A-inhibited guanine nucleotide-exchange protein
MESYVLDAAMKIRHEAPKRTFFGPLRTSCDAIIDKLKSRPADAPEDVDADKYFDLLRQTLETNHPRVMDVALDTIHYLISSGYLRGTRRVSNINQGDSVEIIVEDTTQRDKDKTPIKSFQVIKSIHAQTLIEVVVAKVCIVANDKDDSRSRKVLHVLGAVTNSNNCKIHDKTLLLMVQTCFKIALEARASSIKTVAKEVLLDIYKKTGQRMESYKNMSIRENGSSDERTIGDSDMRNNNDNSIGISTALAAEDEDFDNNGMEKSAAEVILDFVDPEVGRESDLSTKAELTFPSIYHKDMFTLFKYVCTLSMKGQQDDVVNYTLYDTMTLDVKVISLEVVLRVLNGCGHEFKKSEAFIYAVRKYLCVSLLSNCTSQTASITGLSLRVFASLMGSFKENLKYELGIFITNIFLRILESENSTYDHKMGVLEVLQKLCNDQEALVEIFINYDCDLNEVDLFRRIIDALSKITKNPQVSTSKLTVDFLSSSKKLAQEEKSVREYCLKALVDICKSLYRTANLGDSGSGNGQGQSQGLGQDQVLTVSTDKTSIQTMESAERKDEKVVQGDDLSSCSFEVNQELSTVAEEEGITVTNNIIGVSPSPGAGAGAAGANETKVMEAFDMKKKRQAEIETGILKFNLKPIKGITFLVAQGHMEMTPKSIAKFLWSYNDRLDKTQVGDYIGREREYMDGICVNVLHEFVQYMDFTDMLFDDAIRRYLSTFRLPGEAQKIDRLMEKFAERYFMQNRTVFASADIAFILAFSTIMLQTNLHNPAIRDDKRMTKEQFIKQNKGISADGEIPDEMLIGIYERISANKISLTTDADDGNKKKNEGTFGMAFGADKRRKSLFDFERKEMVRATEAMFREKYSKRKESDSQSNGIEFQKAADMSSHEQYVLPMLEVSWPPMMAVFSQVIESYDDVVLNDYCLDGLECLIQMCCRLDLPTGRNAIVNSLCKATTLEYIKPILPKNIQAIKKLLNLALSEGDYLDETWPQVLKCISQLSRLLEIVSGSSQDANDLFKGTNSPTKSGMLVYVLYTTTTLMRTLNLPYSNPNPNPNPNFLFI